MKKLQEIKKKIENQHTIKDISFTDNGQRFDYFEKVKKSDEDELYKEFENFD